MASLSSPNLTNQEWDVLVNLTSWDGPHRLDALDFQGRPLIHHLLFHANYDETIKELLKKVINQISSQNLNERVFNKATVMDWFLLYNQDEEIFNCLTQKGVDLNISGHQEVLPLTISLIHCPEFLLKLIEAGANVSLWEKQDRDFLNLILKESPEKISFVEKLLLNNELPSSYNLPKKRL